MPDSSDSTEPDRPRRLTPVRRRTGDPLAPFATRLLETVSDVGGDHWDDAIWETT